MEATITALVDKVAEQTSGSAAAPITKEDVDQVVRATLKQMRKDLPQFAPLITR